MKQDEVQDLLNLYNQTYKFLEEEGMSEEPQPLSLIRNEYQNTFRTMPEKFLSKDNLLILLKDI
jgi:hypothetical protein